ncbi:MAG: thioredoxin domain-containing protein [Sphingomonas bacterium]
MKFRILCAVLPVLFVAACGKGDAGGNSSASVPAAAPVAGAKAPAGQTWVDVVSKTPEGGYVMGNPNAAVKLIEYGSRSCPHCAVFDAEGFPALKAGPIVAGKLSYEFRDFPVHGAVDIGPILVGHCVEPAQFFPMLDQMMASQQQLIGRTDKKISDADQARLQKSSPGQVATFLADFYGYVDFVKQRGVPDAKVRACLSDSKALDDIAKQADTASRQYNVSGTPTFIVNGTVAANVADWASLQPVLKAAGAL